MDLYLLLGVILLPFPSHLLPGCFSIVVDFSLNWRPGSKVRRKAKDLCGLNCSLSQKGPTLEPKLPSFGKSGHFSFCVGTDVMIVHLESRQNGWAQETKRKIPVVNH